MEGVGTGAWVPSGRGGGSPLRPSVRIALGLLAVLAGAACARPGAPTGGPPDMRPPVVMVTVPPALADVPGFRGPVRFDFDERISEQVGGGRLQDAVIVSPLTGDVRVRHGRRSLLVDMEGGFRDGVVYRITLLPGVRDLFGNALRDPFELVFTTGAEAEETVLAGEVWDRVTGRGLADLALQAIGADSLVHVASSGDGGIYAFRYLPGGRYTLTAFQDNDRNRVPGPTEVQGSLELSVSSGDTLFVDVPVLLPDTTAAILLGAEPLDSVTLVLRFDDYLDPAVALVPSGFTVAFLDDSGGVLPVDAVFHEVAWGDHRTAVRDSLVRADSVASAGAAAAAAALTPADSAEAPAGVQDGPVPPSSPAQIGPPSLPGAAIPGVEAARARGRLLPGRRVVVVLGTPLPADREVQITVGDVVNLNGVSGGGGQVALTRPATEGAGSER